MAFDSVSAFLAMGGYGFYVWLSVGISFLSVILLVGFSVYNRRQLRRNVRFEIARRARIKNARSSTDTGVEAAIIR